MIKRLLLICCVLFPFIISGCKTKGAPSESSSAIFSIIENSSEEFFKNGTIEKIVLPETSENSMIATVDQVAVADNGNIYIGDIYSQKVIFEFDPNGVFINRFGKLGQGPSEYDSLMSFDIGSDGRVYLLANNKIIVYSIDGKYEKECHINYQGGDISIVGNNIFVRSYMAIGDGYFKSDLIKTYDLSLKAKYGLFETDPRLLIYRFLPNKSLVRWKDLILFTDVYDLAFNVLDPLTKKAQRYSFPNNNEKLLTVWNEKAFDEKERTIIKNNLQRFNDIYSMGQYLCLIELNRSKKEANIWLMDYKRKTINKYPLLALQGKVQVDSTKPIKFDYIAGAYKNGLIFVIESEDKLERIKLDYPQYRNIELGLNTNQLLVFYKIGQNE